MFEEALAVVRPGSQTDEGGEVVGHYEFALALLVQSGHTSQFGDAALSCKGSDVGQIQLFSAVGKSEAIFTASDDLDNQVSILWDDSSGQNAENAGAGQVFVSEFAQFSDFGGEVGVFFFFQVDVSP